jgi:phage terminase large subunit-like protein
MTPEERQELAKLPHKKLVEIVMAKEELYRRYTEEKIKFYQPCSPKHKAFHSSEKLIRIIFGGNQSGKSYAGLMELLFRACFKTHPYTKAVNPRPGKYRIFTTKFQIAEEHIVPMLKEWVPKKILKNGNWQDSYDSRYHILTLIDGTIIDILTYDQEASVAESVTLDGIWADEEMPERFFSGSLPRLVRRGGKFWMTVTPLYNLSWAMKYWNCDDKDVDVFKIGIRDNPHLSREAIESLINQWPEDERAARINGEFLEFSGLFYKELDKAAHWIDESKQPNKAWPVIFALDPHPRTGSVMTWAYVTPKDEVVFFDEYETPREATPADIVKAIKAREQTHKAPTILRLIDPASKAQGAKYDTNVLRQLQDLGMGFSEADNSDAGYGTVRDYIRYDKSKDLGPGNCPQVYFTKDGPKTWHGMTHVLWDDWARKADMKDEKEKIKDYLKDFPDCVRYTLVGRPTYNVGRAQPVMIGNKAHPHSTNPLRRKNRLAEFLPGRQKRKVA